MTDPLISIIIPTRERADVLSDTLETILSLKNNNVEIIVCDNASSDETPQVVTNYSDPRLKYHRTTTRISMPQNFERGLQLATGEYIMTMGDDDFIIEENLNLALACAAEKECDLVYWFRACFYWGNYPDPKLASFFSIPIGRRHFNVEPHTLLNVTLRGLVGYYYLPSIYNSLCKRSFLKKYWNYLRGQYFPNYVVSLDIFSALVFCSMSPSVWFQQSPASVSGISYHSNGMSIKHNGLECERFAKELGYSDVSCIMPDEFNGVVNAITSTGVSQLSVLTDYYNVVNQVLKYSYHSPITTSTLNEIHLHRLLSGNHISIDENSELYRQISANEIPDSVLDDLTYFFRLSQIPIPKVYNGTFGSSAATVRHLSSHLESTAFNQEVI